MKPPALDLQGDFMSVLPKPSLERHPNPMHQVYDCPTRLCFDWMVSQRFTTSCYCSQLMFPPWQAWPSRRPLLYMDSITVMCRLSSFLCNLGHAKKAPQSAIATFRRTFVRCMDGQSTSPWISKRVAVHYIITHQKTRQRSTHLLCFVWAAIAGFYLPKFTL